MSDSEVAALRGFARDFLAELLVEALFDAGTLSFAWCGDRDPDELETVPAAPIRMDAIEDALGDFFHHFGDRIVLYAYRALGVEHAAARRYAQGPVCHDVATAVLALCASGAVYRTRPNGRAAVVLATARGTKTLAENVSTLHTHAVADVSDEALRVFREEA